MKVKIEAGTRGWFEVKFRGADSVTFKRDTTVDVEAFRTFWYKTKGQISGLPTGHPGILINEIYLPKDGA
jgi:hypothetical protein